MNKRKTIQTITYIVMAIGAVYPIFKDVYRHLTSTASQSGGGQMDWNSVFLAILPGSLLFAAAVMYKWPFTTKKELSKIPDKVRSLGFRIILEKCQFLIKNYRQLSSSDPENTKKPLSPEDSWPPLEGNRNWSYTQLSLFRNFLYYKWMLDTAKKAFSEMRWEPVPLFIETPYWMAEVLAALEKFEGVLDRKVATLEE